MTKSTWDLWFQSVSVHDNHGGEHGSRPGMHDAGEVAEEL